MKKVDDWFGLFIATHMMRFPREDWPEEMTEEASNFFGAWRHQFILKGLTEDVATRASLDLAGDPPRWLADHLPVILKAAAEIRRQLEPQSPSASPLEDARIASIGCPDCKGNGSTTRFVHAEIFGKRTAVAGNPIPVGGKFTIPCSCPLGKHVARGLAKDGQRPPPTIDQYPSLRRWEVPWGSLAEDGLDCQFAHHPDHWDSLNGCPIPDEGATFTLDKLKALTRKASHFPAEASASRSWSDHTTSLRNRNSEPISPVPGRPDLEAVADDPVVARELSPKPGPRSLSIPEDDAAAGWY